MLFEFETYIIQNETKNNIQIISDYDKQRSY